MAKFKKGSKIEWQWLGRAIQGQVEEVYKTSITKTIKGKKITRHGTEEKPAYLVKAESGNIALKLESELSAGQAKTSRASKPKMFQS